VLPDIPIYYKKKVKNFVGIRENGNKLALVPLLAPLQDNHLFQSRL
jgi:hypothetical protein